MSLFTLLIVAASATLPGVASGSRAGAPDPSAPLAVEVELRAGRTLAGLLASADVGQLRLRVGEVEETVPLDELLLLSLGPAAAPAVASPEAAPLAGSLPPAPPGDFVLPDLVFLVGAKDGAAGDRLVGRLRGGDAYGVRFELDGAGPFPIAFDDIERLLPRADRPVDRLAALEGAGADDRLWRRKPDGSLDHVAGIVESLEGDEVVFDGALGPLRFDLSELAAVVLAGSRAAERELAGRPVVVRLRGGSRLSAGLLELDGERVVLATRFAERLELPLAALASLVVRDAGVVLLADLAPVEVEEWPTVGQPEDFLFPWQADLSVTGRLLSVAGVPRATGIGVHANTRLAFVLPAGARRLRVTAGLVDEVAELPAEGSVRFEIRSDGAVAARSELVREGQPPVVLRVDALPAGGRLELLVDDGGDDDAGDRAAWVDGVILLGDA